MVHAALLRGLPYQDPAKLAIVWLPNRLLNIGFDELPASAGDFYDWQAQSRSFSEMAAFRGRPFNFNLSGTGDTPTRVSAMTATGDFFRVFGGSAAFGRTFTLGEDSPGKRQVAVLSGSVVGCAGALAAFAMLAAIRPSLRAPTRIYQMPRNRDVCGGETDHTRLTP